jgi:hypothetical protein
VILCDGRIREGRGSLCVVDIFNGGDRFTDEFVCALIGGSQVHHAIHDALEIYLGGTQPVGNYGVIY